VITSYYLCDDVVFRHALPNLVHCSVEWGKRVRIPDEVFPFFAVGEAAVVMYVVHWNNQSQPSSFDNEIEKKNGCKEFFW